MPNRSAAPPTATDVSAPSPLRALRFPVALAVQFRLEHVVPFIGDTPSYGVSASPGPY
jgi:hypothetical protein